jgi:hypothetical protein
VSFYALILEVLCSTSLQDVSWNTFAHEVSLNASILEVSCSTSAQKVLWNTSGQEVLLNVPILGRSWTVGVLDQLGPSQK